MFVSDALSVAIRSSAGMLFFAAGVSKLLRQRSIPLIVERYRLLPSRLVQPVARLLGPSEVLLGLALLSSPWLPQPQIASVGAMVLLVAFSLAIASALMRGISIECGCGLLVGDYTTSPLVIARNLLLASLLYLVN